MLEYEVHLSLRKKKAFLTIIGIKKKKHIITTLVSCLPQIGLETLLDIYAMSESDIFVLDLSGLLCGAVSKVQTIVWFGGS